MQGRQELSEATSTITTTDERARHIWPASCHDAPASALGFPFALMIGPSTQAHNLLQAIPVVHQFPGVQVFPLGSCTVHDSSKKTSASSNCPFSTRVSITLCPLQPASNSESAKCQDP